ncbi:MAG: hypothetical protein M3N93_01850, partial [Acidobacteriota bacterium]|nr:hypothetical protein [Acidobacteriota bacterium]
LYNQQRAGAVTNARRAYLVSDLSPVTTMGIASGFAASMVLALYMNSDTVRQLYQSPNVLWLLFPLLLYWITRIWIITARGEMDEDPVLFAAKDRTTFIVIFCLAALMFLATRPGLGFQ